MKALVREKAVAEKMKVSLRTLRQWRDLKIIPFVKVRNVILLDESEVLAALGKFEHKAE
jgi:hypothetical protein